MKRILLSMGFGKRSVPDGFVPVGKEFVPKVGQEFYSKYFKNAFKVTYYNNSKDWRFAHSNNHCEIVAQAEPHQLYWRLQDEES